MNAGGAPGRPVPVEIGRADRHDVRIRWDDGHESLFLARDLRLLCPCATCVSEASGQRILDPANVRGDVRPLGIELVGRYGVRISWSDFHSTGIYSFEYLRGNCPCRRCRGAPPENPGLGP